MATIITRYSQESIAKRIEDLAALISEDFKGEEVYLLGILRGAFVFLADLMRQIQLPCRYDFIIEKMEEDRIIFSSYAGSEIEVDGEELLLIREEDILAVIK